MSTVNDQVRIEDDSSGEGTQPIPPEDGGGIDLGLLRRLIVPEENLDLDDSGQDLDFAQQMLAVVRRPDPQRWFALVDHFWMTTRLLPVASKTSEFGLDWFYVDKTVRAPIQQYLKGVMVCPCFLVHARVWSIWVIPISSTKSLFQKG